MTTKKNENENVKVTTTHAARRCKAQPARNGQPKSVETNGRPLNQSKIKKVPTAGKRSIHPLTAQNKNCL